MNNKQFFNTMCVLGTVVMLLISVCFGFCMMADIQGKIEADKHNPHQVRTK